MHAGREGDLADDVCCSYVSVGGRVRLKMVQIRYEPFQIAGVPRCFACLSLALVRHNQWTNDKPRIRPTTEGTGTRTA